MTFDISQYEITESGTWHATDAKGNPIYMAPDVAGANPMPFTITVASPASPKAMRAAHSAKQASTTNMFAQMAGKTVVRTEFDDIKERAALLVAIFEGTSAEGFTYKGKKGIDAFHAMFLEPKLEHIAIGLEKFHNDRGNFTQGAATK